MPANAESTGDRGDENMVFAIKTEVASPQARTFTFTAQKTMYGGKRIARGDTIFVFASENEGGAGLVARAVVPRLARCRSGVVSPAKRRVSASRSNASHSHGGASGGRN